MRVLFVDDDPMLLEGLSNSLRKYRKQWTMSTALGGGDALRQLQEGSFDVIVSDMRMPGMTGEDLLREVRERWPHMARVVLSGQTEEAVAMRVVHLAHQFLAKPCEGEIIHRLVMNFDRLMRMLPDPEVRISVGRLGSVPCTPSACSMLRRQLELTDEALECIGENVSGDPGMAAKVLQLANSAFFTGAPSVNSVASAVAALGENAVRNVMAETLDGGFVRTAPPGGCPVARAGNRRALRVAALTAAICADVDPDTRDSGYMAGLLHNTGVLVRPVCLAPGAEPGREPDHALIGAYLLGLWGLPEEVVNAIAHQGHPAQADGEGFTLATALHVALWIEGADIQIDMPHLERIGVAGRLEAWKAMATAMEATE